MVLLSVGCLLAAGEHLAGWSRESLFWILLVIVIGTLVTCRRRMQHLAERLETASGLPRCFPLSSVFLLGCRRAGSVPRQTTTRAASILPIIPAILIFWCSGPSCPISYENAPDRLRPATIAAPAEHGGF